MWEHKIYELPYEVERRSASGRLPRPLDISTPFAFQAVRRLEDATVR
jgi:hypothetical protein